MPWRISPLPEEIEPRQRQRERLAERTRRVVLDEFGRAAETSDQDAAFEAALDAFAAAIPRSRATSRCTLWRKSSRKPDSAD
jgi:hypothetical protein